MSDDPTSEPATELGKTRSDEYTERILAFVQEIESTCPAPFIPLLTDLALARALIVHMVIRYGTQKGLSQAREAFDSTFELLKPMLEKMEFSKGDLSR